MKYIVYILLFFPVWVTAQTYKYIGIEDGLSNRRIFNIQKDAQGYMWFLTNEGMDRYNGKDIKHYKLNKEGTILDAPIRLGWLYTEPHIGYMGGWQTRTSLSIRSRQRRFQNGI